MRNERDHNTNAPWRVSSYSDNSTRSVITTIGTDIELYCYAEGYPLPNIYWLVA